jgi:hypothetical protein
VTEPKGKKPESDHPHDEDLPFELHEDPKGSSSADSENPLKDLSLSSSTEDFHFSGPAEELDFTEPADFTFPSELGEPAAAAGQSGELPAAEATGIEGLFGEDFDHHVESPLAEAGVSEGATAVEAAEEIEVAGESAGEESQPRKPQRELPAWIRKFEWVFIGSLAVLSPLAIIIAVFFLSDHKLVTLIFNIACPLMLALIPLALWRSSDRWTTPSTHALYTVMLALSTAALIVGTWFQGIELSHYDWQFSRTRVTAAKPRTVVFMPPSEPTEPAPEPAAAKNTSEPAANNAPDPAKKPADSEKKPEQPAAK